MGKCIPMGSNSGRSRFDRGESLTYAGGLGRLGRLRGEGAVGEGNGILIDGGGTGLDLYKPLATLGECHTMIG